MSCVRGSYPQDVPVVSSVEIQGRCSFQGSVVRESRNSVDVYPSSILCMLETLMKVEGSYFVREGKVCSWESTSTYFYL